MNETEERLRDTIQIALTSLHQESDMNSSFLREEESEDDRYRSSDGEGGMWNRRHHFYISRPQQKEDDEEPVQDDEDIVNKTKQNEISVDSQQLRNKSITYSQDNSILLQHKDMNYTNTTMLAQGTDGHHKSHYTKNSFEDEIQPQAKSHFSKLEQNDLCKLNLDSNNEIKVSLSHQMSSPKKNKNQIPKLSELSKILQSSDEVYESSTKHQNGQHLQPFKLGLDSQNRRRSILEESQKKRKSLLYLGDESNFQSGCLQIQQMKYPEQLISDQEAQQQKEIDEQNKLQDPANDGQKHGLIGVWQHSSLLIITLVKKFQNMLMSHNNESKFRCLEKQHFEVIGDRSVFYRYYLKLKQAQDLMYKKNKKNAANAFTRQLSQNPYNLINSLMTFRWFQDLIIRLLHNVSVIQPNSKMKILWNILLFILLILNFFMIPLKVTFDQLSNKSIILQRLTNISSIIFLLDTLINFNSAYFSKGLIITDRKKIIHNYVKNNLLFDFITLLSYLLSIFSAYQLEAGVLIKILKLAPLIENFEEILNLKQRGQAILSLVKLIMFIIMVTHILGCSFFLFARIENIYFPYSSNWIQEKEYWQTEWYDQYVLSLYWSVVTMITVGYGDITPVNMQERLFVIITMLISCGVFAYSINSIGRILEELSKRDAIFRDNISLVTSYLKQRGISYDLQLRIRKYFQYLHRENLEDNEKSEGLMDLLPRSLKNELGVEMYVKIINDQKVFKLNFTQKFIIELSLKMKEKRFGPEEIVFQEKDYLDKLYFLIKGSVQLFVNIKDSNNSPFTSISILGKGRLLGQGAFFTQLPCSSGARCINVTSLVYITREDFIEVIRKYPKDYEKFCMLRDNLRINNISRGLGTKCHLCGSFNHSFQTCHLVRYNPTKDKIILKYNKANQSRDPCFVRQTKRKPQSSARSGYLELKDITINFLFDQTQEESEDESILQVIDNIKQYYVKEFKKWNKIQESSNEQDSSDHQMSSKRKSNYFNSSPGPAATEDAFSALLNDQINKKGSFLLNDNDTLATIMHAQSLSKKRKKSSDEGNNNANPVSNLISFSNQNSFANNNNINNSINFNHQNSFANNNNNNMSYYHSNSTSNNNNNLESVNINQVQLFKRKRVKEHSGSQDTFSLRQNSMGISNNQLTQLQQTHISPHSLSENQLYKSQRRIVNKTASLKNEESVISDDYSRRSRQPRRRGYVILGPGGFDEDQQMKRIFFSDIEELDRFQIFEIYFIEGNINKILDQYNNNYLHLKEKEDNDIMTKKRHAKKLLTKKRKLSKSARLKTLVIQKRSQNQTSQPGTQAMNSIQIDSPLASDKLNRSSFYQAAQESIAGTPNKEKSIQNQSLPYIGKPYQSFTNQSIANETVEHLKELPIDNQNKK